MATQDRRNTSGSASEVEEEIPEPGPAAPDGDEARRSRDALQIGHAPLRRTGLPPACPGCKRADRPFRSVAGRKKAA